MECTATVHRSFIRVSIFELVLVGFACSMSSSYDRQDCTTNQQIYEGDCYAVFADDHKTYEDARNDCKRYQRFGDLPIIRKLTDEAFLKSIMDDDNAYWLGFRDSVGDGIYTWVDNTTLGETGYTNWQSEKESGSDCAVMRGNEDSRWDSINCDVQNGYVCKFPGAKAPALTRTRLPTLMEATTSMMRLPETTSPATTTPPTTNPRTPTSSTTVQKTMAMTSIRTTTTIRTTVARTTTPPTTWIEFFHLQTTLPETTFDLTVSISARHSTSIAPPLLQGKRGISEEVRRQVPYLTITTILAIVVAVIVVLDLIYLFGRQCTLRNQNQKEIIGLKHI